VTAHRPIDESNADSAILVPAWVDGVLVPVGKIDVHRRGLRHKAVSVFVTAGDRLLIQRRAAAKYHCGGLWANTCCTHPLWNEAAADCASRRLGEELGLRGVDLRPRPAIEYRADVGGGMIEHEVVDVFVGALPTPVAVAPDPAEVEATRWVTLEALRAEIEAAPARFTPWMRIYVAEHLDAILGGAARAS
jgi:isopentenyl-diphosphate delta-isomerase